MTCVCRPCLHVVSEVRYCNLSEFISLRSTVKPLECLFISSVKVFIIYVIYTDATEFMCVMEFIGT